MKTTCNHCKRNFDAFSCLIRYCDDPRCQKAKTENENKKRKAWLQSQKSVCKKCGKEFNAYKRKNCYECQPERKRNCYPPIIIKKPPKCEQAYAKYLKKDKKKNWVEYKPTDIHGNKVECTTAHSGHG